MLVLYTQLDCYYIIITLLHYYFNETIYSQCLILLLKCVSES